MKKLRSGPATVLASLLLAFVVPVPVTAQPADVDAYGDDYQTGDFGRIRYLENGVTVRRSVVDPGAPPEEQGSLNGPIFPGDTVLTGYDQRAEIQLAGGSIVRIDRSSELTFLALPDPYAVVDDNSVLQLGGGTLRLAASLRDKEEFRIDTPAASVYLLGDGDFRIEVDSRGRTSVASRRGVAEVVSSDSSVLVRAGMQTEVAPDLLPAEPAPFNTFVSDSFDRWVDKREAVYRDLDRYAGSADAYEALPDEVRPHYRELSVHGDWHYDDDYGYVWSPDDIGRSWRPYYDGYWDYGPHGYFWVSNEPWGWAPYHYGRWSYVGSIGWCWIPGRVFAGAWVAWSWGSVHVGWAALDYWNAPVYVHGYHHGYYDYNAWTVVGYHDLHHHYYPRYAVPVDHVGDHLRRHTAVVTRPPRVSPRALAESPESRVAAARHAREDQRSRLEPTENATRGRRNLAEVDDRLTRRNEGRSRAASTEARVQSNPSRVQARRPSRVESRGARTESAVRPERSPGTRGTAATRTVERSRSTRTTQPERRSTAATTGRRSTVPKRMTPGSTSRATSRPRATTGEADKRRRDLYQKMSSPRTTRGRSTADRPSRSTTPSSSARKPRSTPARTPARERAAPSPSGTSNRKPSASSSRSSSKRPTPRAKSSSSSSKRPIPRAKSSSSSSKRPTPRAKSSSSSSKRPTPRAKSSSSSSKRPTPRAKSSSSSSRAPSKARSGSSGGHSTPKASSSSSRGSSKSSRSSSRSGRGSKRR